MSGHVYCYHYTTCIKQVKWAVMCIVTITLPVQSQDNKRSCVLLPLRYLYKARTMSGHMYCYHYTTCTKPDKWAVMCIVTITLPYKARTMRGHVYCYHYTTCAKPGQSGVMCIVTITLPVQSQDNERSCVLLPLYYLYKASTISGHVDMLIVTITIPVQSQDNERSCVLLPLHCLYKAR